MKRYIQKKKNGKKLYKFFLQNLFFILIIFSCSTPTLVTLPKINYKNLIEEFFENDFINHFPIINFSGSNLHPSVSQNGFLVYTSNETGSNDIRLRDLTSSNDFSIIQNPGEQYKPSISGDSKIVAYVSETYFIEGGIMITKIDSEYISKGFTKGQNLKNYWNTSVNLSEKFKQWSEKNLEKRCHGVSVDIDPYLNLDGTKLLFASNRCTHSSSSSSETFNIWLLELDNLKIKKVKKITNSGGVGARFSRDESKIIYYNNSKNKNHLRRGSAKWNSGGGVGGDVGEKKSSGGDENSSWSGGGGVSKKESVGSGENSSVGGGISKNKSSGGGGVSKKESVGSGGNSSGGGGASESESVGSSGNSISGGRSRESENKSGGGEENSSWSGGENDKNDIENESEIKFFIKDLNTQKQKELIFPNIDSNSKNNKLYINYKYYNPDFGKDNNTIIYLSVREDTNQDGVINLSDNAGIYIAKIKDDKIINEKQILESSANIQNLIVLKNINDNINPKISKNLIKTIFSNGIFYSANNGDGLNIYYLPENGIIPEKKNIKEQYNFIQNYKNKNNIRYELALNNFLYFYNINDSTNTIIKYKAKAANDLEGLLNSKSKKEKNSNNKYKLNILKSYILSESKDNLLFDFFFKYYNQNKIQNEKYINNFSEKISNFKNNDSYIADIYFEEAKLYNKLGKIDIALQKYKKISYDFQKTPKLYEIYLEYFKTKIKKLYLIKISENKSLTSFLFDSEDWGGGGDKKLLTFLEDANPKIKKELLLLINENIVKNKKVTKDNILEEVNLLKKYLTENSFLVKVFELAYIAKDSTKIETQVIQLEKLFEFSKKLKLKQINFTNENISLNENNALWNLYSLLCLEQILNKYLITNDYNKINYYSKKFYDTYKVINYDDDIKNIFIKNNYKQNLISFYINLLTNNKTFIDLTLNDYENKITKDPYFKKNFNKTGLTRKVSLVDLINNKINKDNNAENILLNKEQSELVSNLCENTENFFYNYNYNYNEKILELNNNESYQNDKNKFCKKLNEVNLINTKNKIKNLTLDLYLSNLAIDLIYKQNISAFFKLQELQTLDKNNYFKNKINENKNYTYLKSAVDLAVYLTDKLLIINLNNYFLDFIIGDLDIFNSKYFVELDIFFKSKLENENSRQKVDYLNAQAYLYLQKNILRDGLYTQKKISNLYFNNSFLQVRKKEIFEELKQAELNLKTSIFIDPSNISTYLLKTWLYQYIEEQKKTTVYYKTTLITQLIGQKLNHEKEESYYLKYYEDYFPDKYYETNVDQIKKVILNSKNNPIPIIDLSRLYLNLGNYQFILLNFEEALKSYKEVYKVLKKNNNYIFENPVQEKLFYFNFGRALINDGQFEESIFYFKQAYLKYYEEHLFYKSKLKIKTKKIIDFPEILNYYTTNFQSVNSNKNQNEYFNFLFENKNNLNISKINFINKEDNLENNNSINRETEFNKSRARLALISAMMGLANWQAGNVKKAIFEYELADFHLSKESYQIGELINRENLINFLALAYQDVGEISKSNSVAKVIEEKYSKEKNLKRDDSKYISSNTCVRIVGCFFNFGEDFSVIGIGRNPYGFDKLRLYELSLGIQLQNNLLKGDLEEVDILLKKQRNIFRENDLDVQHGQSGFITNFNQKAFREYEQEHYQEAANIFKVAANQALNFARPSSYINNIANALQSQIYYLDKKLKEKEYNEVISKCKEYISYISVFKNNYNKLIKNEFTKKRKAEFPGYRFNPEKDGLILIEKIQKDEIPINLIEASIYFIYATTLREKNSASEKKLSDNFFIKAEKLIKYSIEILLQNNEEKENIGLLIHCYYNLAKIQKEIGQLQNAKMYLEKMIDDAYELQLTKEELLGHVLLYRINEELFQTYKTENYNSQAKIHINKAENIFIKNSFLYETWQNFEIEIISTIVEYNIKNKNYYKALQFLEYDYSLNLEWEFLRHQLGNNYLSNLKSENKYKQIRKIKYDLLKNENLKYKNLTKQENIFSNTNKNENEINSEKQQNYQIKNLYNYKKEFIKENNNLKYFISEPFENYVKIKPNIEENQTILRFYKINNSLYCFKFNKNKFDFFSESFTNEEWEKWNNIIIEKNNFEFKLTPNINKFLNNILDNNFENIKDLFLIVNQEFWNYNFPYYLQKLHQFNQDKFNKKFSNLPLAVFSTRLSDSFIGRASSLNNLIKENEKFNLLPLIYNDNIKNENENYYSNIILKNEIIEIENVGLNIIWQASQNINSEKVLRENFLDRTYRRFEIKKDLNTLNTLNNKEVKYINKSINDILLKNKNINLAYIKLKEKEFYEIKFNLLYEILRAHKIPTLLILKNNEIQNLLNKHKLNYILKNEINNSSIVLFGYVGTDISDSKKFVEKEIQKINLISNRLEKDEKYNKALKEKEKECFFSFTISINQNDETISNCILDINRLNLLNEKSNNNEKLSYLNFLNKNLEDIKSLNKINKIQKSKDSRESINNDKLENILVTQTFEILIKDNNLFLFENFYLSQNKKISKLLDTLVSEIENKIELGKLKENLSNNNAIKDFNKSITKVISYLKLNPDFEIIRNLIKHNYFEIAKELLIYWEKNKLSKDVESINYYKKYFTHNDQIYNKNFFDDSPLIEYLKLSIEYKNIKIENNKRLIEKLSEHDFIFKKIYLNINKNISLETIDEIINFLDYQFLNFSYERATWMTFVFTYKLLILEDFDKSLVFYKYLLSKNIENSFQNVIYKNWIITLNQFYKTNFYNELKSYKEKINSLSDYKNKIYKINKISNPKLFLLSEMFIALKNNNSKSLLNYYFQKTILTNKLTKDIDKNYFTNITNVLQNKIPNNQIFFGIFSFKNNWFKYNIDKSKIKIEKIDKSKISQIELELNKYKKYFSLYNFDNNYNSDLLNIFEPLFTEASNKQIIYLYLPNLFIYSPIEKYLNIFNQKHFTNYINQKIIYISNIFSLINSNEIYINKNLLTDKNKIYYELVKPDSNFENYSSNNLSEDDLLISKKILQMENISLENFSNLNKISENNLSSSSSKKFTILHFWNNLSFLNDYINNLQNKKINNLYISANFLLKINSYTLSDELEFIKALENVSYSSIEVNSFVFFIIPPLSLYQAKFTNTFLENLVGGQSFEQSYFATKDKMLKENNFIPILLFTNNFLIYK